MIMKYTFNQCKSVFAPPEVPLNAARGIHVLLTRKQLESNKSYEKDTAS